MRNIKRVHRVASGACLRFSPALLPTVRGTATTSARQNLSGCIIFCWRPHLMPPWKTWVTFCTEPISSRAAFTALRRGQRSSLPLPRWRQCHRTREIKLCFVVVVIIFIIIAVIERLPAFLRLSTTDVFTTFESLVIFFLVEDKAEFMWLISVYVWHHALTSHPVHCQ